MAVKPKKFVDKDGNQLSSVVHERYVKDSNGNRLSDKLTAIGNSLTGNFALIPVSNGDIMPFAKCYYTCMSSSDQDYYQPDNKIIFHDNKLHLVFHILQSITDEGDENVFIVTEKSETGWKRTARYSGSGIPEWILKGFGLSESNNASVINIGLYASSGSVMPYSDVYIFSEDGTTRYPVHWNSWFNNDEGVAHIAFCVAHNEGKGVFYFDFKMQSNGLLFVAMYDSSNVPSVILETLLEKPSVSIVDNLTTEDATKALSAKQGKVLNTNLSNIALDVEQISETVAGHTQSIQSIAATGGASTAAAVIFEDGGNAESKVCTIENELFGGLVETQYASIDSTLINSSVGYGFFVPKDDIIKFSTDIKCRCSEWAGKTINTQPVRNGTAISPTLSVIADSEGYFTINQTLPSGTTEEQCQSIRVYSTSKTTTVNSKLIIYTTQQSEGLTDVVENHETRISALENDEYEGLKIVAFGDSITDGKVDESSESTERVEWVNVLASRLSKRYLHLKMAIGGVNGTPPYSNLSNYDVINMGCSGMRIAALSGYVDTDGTDGTAITEGATAKNNFLMNWIRRFDTFNTDSNGCHIVEPDFFIIAAGTNDVSQGSNKGQVSDAFDDTQLYIDNYDSLDETNMCCALKKAILHLQKNYPNSIVIYCTPIQGGYGGRTIQALGEVSEKCTGVANRMNAPVCNLFAESGINGIFENAAHISAGDTRDTIDGVHVRQSGAKKMAKRIDSRLKEFI